MKKVLLGILGAAAVAAAGAEGWTGSGLLETANVADIVNPDGSAAPFRMGAGMLKYVGPTATYANDMLFSAGSSGASTVWVDDPSATLTLSGTLSQDAGAFIKAGPGTLRYTGPEAKLGRGQSSSSANAPISFDADGRADRGYSYGNFIDGRTVIDGAGLFWFGNMNYIGAGNQADVYLDVINGATLEFPTSWTCINRGNSRSDNAYGSYVTVSNGAAAKIGQLVMLNANGTSSYYGRGHLTVADRASVTVGSTIYQSEGRGESVITVSNRASFVNNAQLWGWDNGWEMGVWSADQKASTYVQNASTGMAHAVFIREGSKLEVTDGSVFAYGRPVPRFLTARTGDANFDGATLATRTVNPSEWFYNHRALNVGPHGVDLVTDGYAALFPPIRAWNADAPGPVVKKGAGTVALTSVDCPVSVQEGALRLSAPNLERNENRTAAVSFAAGTRAEIAGEGSAGGYALDGVDEVVLEAAGLETRTNAWACNGYARVTSDRRLLLTEYSSASTANTSSSFFRRKVRVDASFRLDWSLAGVRTGAGTPNGGFTVVLQNSPDGLASVARGGQAYLGYLEGSYSNRSFAAMIDFRGDKKCLRWGENGASLGMLPGTLNLDDFYRGLASPVACSLAYDADAKVATFTLKGASGLARSESHPVDLPALLGGNEAYFGFGAASEGADTGTMFSVRDVHVRGSSGVVRTGGRLAATAGKGARLALRPSARLDGFVMDRLTFADGAELTVDVDPASARAPLPPLTLANHDLWQLSQQADRQGVHWVGEDALALSNEIVDEDGTATRYRGEAHAKLAYPVTGSWTCTFDFLMGRKSGTPADSFTFGLAPGSASSPNQFVGRGLELDLRYYINASPYKWTCVTLRKANANVFCVTNDPSAFNMGAEDMVRVRLAYDEDARTLDIELAGEKTGTWSRRVEDFSMADAMGGERNANVRFFGNVGGLWSENIVSNLVFASADMDAAVRAPSAYAAFDAYQGAGTLVKKGQAGLAVLGTNAQHVALTLAEGGLRLAKEQTDDIRMNDDGGWCFSDDTGLLTETGVRIGSLVSNNRNTAHYRRRVRVNGRWRLSYDVHVSSGGSSYPADALALGFHDDPRGTSLLGNPYGNAGIAGAGLKKGWAIAWYLYNSASLDKIGFLSGDGQGIGYQYDFSAVPMRNNSLTHHELVYDADAKTLALTMTNAEGGRYENVFEDVDIPGRLGNDYGWFMLGTGGGGAHTLADFRNLEFVHLDEPQDFLPETPLLAGLTVRAGAGDVTLQASHTGMVFRVAETVSVEAGARLSAVASDRGATLAMGAVELAAGASLGGDGTAVIRPEAVRSADGVLAVDGGAVELASRDLLPSDGVLRLSGGAKVVLPFSGAMRLQGIELDGVPLPRNRYTAEKVDWIVGPGALSTGMGTALILR